MKLKSVFFILFSLSACTSVQQKLDSNVFYPRDMSLEVNGQKAEGVIVVPRANKFDIKIKAKGDLDMFILETCHRHVQKEEAWDIDLPWPLRWFESKAKLKFTYSPVKGIEDTHSCPIQLYGLEKIDGRHSFGFIDFAGTDTTMTAYIKCNGVQKPIPMGVSACQARVGLRQEIIFPEKVFVPKQCQSILKTEDEQRFWYFMPPGQTTCRFRGQESKRDHRTTLLGVEGILVRGD